MKAAFRLVGTIHCKQAKRGATAGIAVASRQLVLTLVRAAHFEFSLTSP